MRVRDVMSTKVVTIDLRDPLERARAEMDLAVCITWSW